MKRLAPYLAVLGAVVVLDQVTKALLVRFLGLHEYHPLIDGLLSLSHVHNRGAAFGVLSGASLPYQHAAAGRAEHRGAPGHRVLLPPPAGRRPGSPAWPWPSSSAARSAT